LVWRLALRIPCSGRSQATIAEHSQPELDCRAQHLAKLSSSHERRPKTEAEPDSSWPRRLAVAAEAVVANPFFAYPAILALQLRFMWNVWSYRDTSSGDTSYYFLYALKWKQHLQDEIISSPLYTNYFGTVLWLVRDVVSAVLVHRLVVVFGATLLVLALSRALLGPAVGLLVALWWTVVPANFNIDYEVHLFGFLPVLVAALVVARWSGRTARGIALAFLVGATLLARNELLIAAIIFAAALVIAEFRQRRTRPISLGAYLRSYGTPLLIVGLLTAGALWQSPAHGRDARASLDAHHGLNMCQIYAFNYQQRHPTEFVGNPFTDCAPLMQRVFGRPMPSFFQEIRANPKAVAEFVAWNVRLAPIGLQVALFGGTSRGLNPGYFPVKVFQRYAAILTLLMLAIVGASLAFIIRDRACWLHKLRTQRWAVLVLAAASTTAIVASLTQRPRAEYIYGLTLSLMLLTAACIAVLLRQINVTRFVPAIAAVATLVLILALPPYYRPGPRPLHDALDRLDGVRTTLQQPGAVLVTSGYNWEICAYFATGFDRHCSSPSWVDVEVELENGKSVTRILEDADATVIYADPVLRAEPDFAAFLASPPSTDWRVVGSGAGTDGRWSVLVHRGAE
jgi:hypothetical protein